MVEGVLFLGAVLVGLTQVVRLARKKDYDGVITIASAVVLGIIVALIDKEIGVTDLTVAEGIMAALAAVGVVTTAEKVG